MTDAFYSQLGWLPPKPNNFREACKAFAAGAADASSGAVGRAARALANHALDASALGTLARALRQARAAGADLAPLVPFRLGVVGSGTLDFLGSALEGTAARHGIALEVVQGDFGQFLQDALSSQSRLNQAGLDAVLLALDHHAFSALGAPGSVDEALGLINALREGFRGNGVPLCLVSTIAPPAEPLFGHLDRSLDAAPRGAIAEINRQLAASLCDSPDVLFDVAALAELVGLYHWHSPQQWNLAKLQFDQAFVPLYADHVCRLIGALKGKARRCLILDLDNTVWGGIIGDDGMDGIRIAQGDAVGEAFLNTQATALALRARGVVLAVSSKNTDEIARAVFRDHPDMLLREDHIAVFQANWSDKATNISAIAETLSLGLESMVFLDDNPMERDLVRRMLPDVAVPELPDDPALYARTLLAAGYFEALTFSDEDRARADFYQDNAKRVALQTAAGDLDGYLRSLQMELSLAPFDSVGRPRIAQLIAKSNQFNLTTRRYSEADVAAVEQDPSVVGLQIRLVDAFGDNGMISVVICRPRDPHTWEIDTWLMSCRVLGRRVEEAVLRELVLLARARGVRRLVGVYRPTERNALVKDHYAKLGFVALDEENGEWSFDVDRDVAEAPMRVRRLWDEARGQNLGHDLCDAEQG